MIEARALSFGVTPNLTNDQMYMGSVLSGPMVKKVTMNSSKVSVKAINAPASTPGRMRGNVTCQKVRHGVAPRSIAAASSCWLNPYRREATTRTTNGPARTHCPAMTECNDNDRYRTGTDTLHNAMRG